MSEPRELKIWNIDSIKDKEGTFIRNQKDSTAIKVPQRVYNTIYKINNLPNGLNHIFIDVLATAINKRRLEGVTEALEAWRTSSVKMHYYPQCNVNISFSKFIRTFARELCAKHFTDNEINHLIQFFAKCPHGYNVGWLIRAHAELKPVIT